MNCSEVFLAIRLVESNISFYLLRLNMQHKGHGKATKVDENVAKWTKICLSTVLARTCEIPLEDLLFSIYSITYVSALLLFRSIYFWWNLLMKFNLFIWREAVPESTYLIVNSNSNCANKRLSKTNSSITMSKGRFVWNFWEH